MLRIINCHHNGKKTKFRLRDDCTVLNNVSLKETEVTVNSETLTVNFYKLDPFSEKDFIVPL